LKMREEQSREAFAKNFDDTSKDVAKGVDNYDANVEKKIKDDKKSKAREQLKIIKQFDSLSEQFV